MSTYLELVCLDCGETTYDGCEIKDSSSSQDTLAAIWRERAAIAELMKRLSVDDLTVDYVRVPLDFITVHLEHNVHLRNGYDRLDTDCNQFIPRVGSCRRKRGHLDGGCAAERDYIPEKLP